MKNIRIPLDRFDGGLNEVARPNILGESEVQTCENYEIREPGQLHRRTEPDTYDADLDALLGTTFDTVLVMSEPYYPETLMTEMDGFSEFILFFFGESGSDYLLYAIYKDTTGWVADAITIDGVTYTANSDMWITIGEDRVIFTDGITPAHYYLINYDGDVVSGKLGIPAPLNKATVTQITAWDAQDWEEDEDNTYMSAPGLFQCLYTTVTKDGEESNPSPLSETLDMQFFKLSSGNDARWINKVNISNLIVPSVSSDIMEKLKYFNVYYRVIRYSEGKAPVALQFGQQFEIIDKELTRVSPATLLTTGNSYTLTVEVSLGEYASYENDVAPVARYAVQNAGVITLANVKKKIRFPWDFEYYCEIKLNNLDNKTYVDAVVRIRLYDTGAVDPIDNFTADDYIDGSSLENTEYVRIFDSDLTTPINAVVMDMTGGPGGAFEILVKIPQLEAGTTHSIYLCWVTAASMASIDGVVSPYNTVDYGKWIYDNDDWADQTVFNHIKVSNYNMLICSPVKDEFESTEVINKVDTENIGVFSDTGLVKILWDSENLCNLPHLSQVLAGGKCIEFHPTTTEELMVEYDDLTITEIPERGTVMFRWYTPNIAYGVNPPGVFACENTGTSRKLSIILHDTGSYWEFRVYVGTVGYDTAIHAAGLESFVALSWDGDDISMFAWNSSNGWEYHNEAAPLTVSDRADLDKIQFGGIGKSATNERISEFRFISDVYYDSTNADDINTVKNIANYMPPFETIVGFKYSDVSVNNNITFEDSVEIKLKEYRNMLVWSDINGVNFPDLYFKRVTEPIKAIIKAPSFLKYQYENTNIIFTRNTISRFILSGTPDGWRAQTESLVGEYKQVALLANKTLVKWKDTLFWLSESGAIMWSPEGLKLISKHRIEIEVDEDAIAFFSPIRNQYIVSNGNLSKTYSY